MDPAHSDDAQRTLEQHALRNVRSLAERLGYADAMDRKHDRAVIIGIGVVVAAVVVFLGARMILTKEDPKQLERHRCQVEKSVQLVDRKRARLMQANPGITPQELVTRATVTDADVKDEAARLCAGVV
jgi:hypothetical protein